MTHQIKVNWGGHLVRLTWYPLKALTEQDIVTSAHGYCFDQGKVCLVKIKGRGFNIPGGHVEPGETPKAAFHREAFEEGYVKGKSEYLGAIEVSHEENPLFDPKGNYPLVGFQVFYRMDIEDCFPFRREHESSTRIWVEPEEIPYVMNDHELALKVLEAALTQGSTT